MSAAPASADRRLGALAGWFEHRFSRRRDAVTLALVPAPRVRLPGGASGQHALALRVVRTYARGRSRAHVTLLLPGTLLDPAEPFDTRALAVYAAEIERALRQLLATKLQGLTRFYRRAPRRRAGA